LSAFHVVNNWRKRACVDMQNTYVKGKMSFCAITSKLGRHHTQDALILVLWLSIRSGSDFIFTFMLVLSPNVTYIK